LDATNHAKWALLAPVIILGGIYGGIFTVTEASIVAVVYAIIVGFLIYRELDLKKFFDALIYMAHVSGTLMIVVITGRIFGRLLTIFQIPQAVSRLLVTTIHSPVALVLLIDLLLLFIGMWMESITQIIILTPLLLPAVVKLGIHPIQFGVMFTIAREIGYETPPLGVNLFVASGLADTTIEKISKEAIVFAAAEIAALVLVSLIPQISLFIPQILGYVN
jgi:C4-dicarboxylate transporter DctM subunit